MLTYDDANLADHGVTRENIDDVLESDLAIESELPPSRRGNERMMLIGFSAGRLLEIGIEFFHDEDRMHIFHADDASKSHKILFEREVTP